MKKILVPDRIPTFGVPANTRHAWGRSDELAVGRAHPLIDGEVYSCRAIYKTRCLHTVRIRYVKSMLVGDK